MKLAPQPKLYEIVDGPSKFDLMLSLFSKTNSTVFVTFDIKVTDDSAVRKVRICVFINAVGKEDGSGESWNFEGYLARIGDLSLPESQYIKGYFSTKTRTGTVTLRLVE